MESSKSAMEDFGAGVEGVDDHLAVDGAGDLDAAVEEVGGEWSDDPVGGADEGGFGEEVGTNARVKTLLAGDAGGEELFAAGVELALEGDGEGEGCGREDVGVGGGDGGLEGDSEGFGHSLLSIRQ